jgi:pyruvate/2-oxoglutarate/acetoin dehydrogenase E1 component
VFTLTRGLHARWPERLLDTPISETAVMGLAIAAAEGFWTLDAPVMRVTPPPTPAPYAPNLEAQWLPGRKDIERAVAELVRI